MSVTRGNWTPPIRRDYTVSTNEHLRDDEDFGNSTDCINQEMQKLTGVSYQQTQKRRPRPEYVHAVRRECTNEEMEERNNILSSPVFKETFRKQVELFGEETANRMLERVMKSWLTKEVSPARQVWK